MDTATELPASSSASRRSSRPKGPTRTDQSGSRRQGGARRERRLLERIEATPRSSLRADTFVDMGAAPELGRRREGRERTARRSPQASDDADRESRRLSRSSRRWLDATPSHSGDRKKLGSELAEPPREAERSIESYGALERDRERASERIALQQQHATVTARNATEERDSPKKERLERRRTHGQLLALRDKRTALRRSVSSGSISSFRPDPARDSGSRARLDWGEAAD